MPTNEIWLQYSIVAIVVLATGLIAGGLYKLWRELLAWVKAADGAREAEREKQRTWEQSQAETRNAQWQGFLQKMQAEWLRQDGRNTEILEKLVDRVEGLTVSLNNHDTFLRASIQKVKK